MDEYKKITSLAEKDLETLKRKFSVARHQLSMLYKEHIEEANKWKTEKEKYLSTIKKLNETVAVDSVKLQEYDVNYFLKIIFIDMYFCS